MGDLAAEKNITNVSKGEWSLAYRHGPRDHATASFYVHLVSWPPCLLYRYKQLFTYPLDASIRRQLYVRSAGPGLHESAQPASLVWNPLPSQNTQKARRRSRARLLARSTDVPCDDEFSGQSLSPYHGEIEAHTCRRPAYGRRMPWRPLRNWASNRQPQRYLLRPPCPGVLVPASGGNALKLSTGDVPSPEASCHSRPLRVLQVIKGTPARNSGSMCDIYVRHRLKCCVHSTVRRTHCGDRRCLLVEPPVFMAQIQRFGASANWGTRAFLFSSTAEGLLYDAYFAQRSDCLVAARSGMSRCFDGRHTQVTTILTPKARLGAAGTAIYCPRKACTGAGVRGYCW
ncbi:hypothetical protein OH77DRAFT_59737 [Trametes cingulata]|nr:hypothetical protein OH77DRAFT_59737 [Trametes cingulata]